MAKLFVSDTPPDHAPLASKFDKKCTQHWSCTKHYGQIQEYDNSFLQEKILEIFAVLLGGEIAMSEKFLDFIIKIEPDKVPTKNAGEIRKLLF